MSNVIDIINGTTVVPIHFPTSFTPSELDKLGYTGALTLAWSSIAGGFVLIFATRDWRKYSYTPLCIAWLWSVAIFAFGIFSRYGKYGHFMTFLAIAHVQIEWLIITFLLGYSFAQAFLNFAIVGLIFYLTDLGIPNIRPSFVATVIGGGWGDVFIPLLLWNGGKKVLAIGAVGHFLNALVTFVAFVDYIPVSLYFALELIFGGTHVTATVFGILRNQQQVPPIHLEDGETNGNGADKDDTVEERAYLIPPPDRKTVIKLGVIAAVVSLAASLPLNFAPKM